MLGASWLSQLCDREEQCRSICFRRLNRYVRLRQHLVDKVQPLPTWGWAQQHAAVQKCAVCLPMRTQLHACTRALYACKRC